MVVRKLTKIPNKRQTRKRSRANPVLVAALAYGKRGWPVFPCYAIVDGQCDCGDADCRNPGKHPCTKHGFKDASTDAERIRGFFDDDPAPNVAIRTGAESGIVVLDIDPRNGGDESLEALEREHGRLPKTVEAVSGGNGRHIYGNSGF